MFKGRLLIVPVAAAIASATLPLPPGVAGTAHAHGIGDRYDLALTVSFFATAGGAAVVSFVIVGLLLRGDSRPIGYPRFNLFRNGWIEFLLGGPSATVIQTLVAFRPDGLSCCGRPFLAWPARGSPAAWEGSRSHPS